MRNKNQIILSRGVLLVIGAIMIHFLMKNYTGPMDKDLVDFFLGLSFGFGTAMMLKGFYALRNKGTACQS